MVGERQTGHMDRAYLGSFIGEREKGSSERPPGKRKRKGWGEKEMQKEKEEEEEEEEVGRVLPFKETGRHDAGVTTLSGSKVAWPACLDANRNPKEVSSNASEGVGGNNEGRELAFFFYALYIVSDRKCGPG